MFKVWGTLYVAFLCLFTMAEENNRASLIQFRLLKFKYPNNITLTSDRQHIALSSSHDNKVSIFKIGDLIPEKVLDIHSPFNLLSRNGKLYVASNANTIINIFSEKNWQKEREVDLSKGLVTPGYIVRLSAPGGQYFKNEILIHLGDRIFKLDTETLQKKEIANNIYGKPSNSSISSYTGENIPCSRGQLIQYYPGTLWFGHNTIFTGIPLQKLSTDSMLNILPDINKKRCFILHKDRITVHSINTAFTQIGGFKPDRVMNMPLRSYANYNLNIAFIRDGTVYLYVYDSRKDAEMLCTIPEEKFHIKIDNPPNAPANKFVSLPLDEPPSSLEMSEDGRYMFIAQKSNEKVEVWDIAKERIVKSIKSKEPQSILSRKGYLYVAEHSTGLINIYSRKSNWKLVNQISVGEKNLIFMTAPRNAAFKGRILACCPSPEQYSSLYKIIEVDVKEDRARVLQTWALNPRNQFNFDYTGTYLWSRNGYFLDYNKVLSLKSNTPAECGVSWNTDNESIVQFWRSSYWLGKRHLFSSSTFSRIKKDFGPSLFPDILHHKFYGLKWGTITEYALDPAQTRLNSWKVNTSALPEYSGFNEYPLMNWGVTLYDTTYLFTGFSGRLFYCKLNRVGERKIIVQHKEEYKDNIFYPIPLKDIAESICMTEDGNYLILPQKTYNHISIWDVKKCQIIRTIPCPNPVYAIERKNMIYILSVGERNHLNIISKKSWKIIKNINLNISGSFFLSAPSGEYFNNKILVTSSCSGNNIYEVDASAGSVKKKYNAPGSIATFDYTGKSVLLLSENNNSKSCSSSDFSPQYDYYKRWKESVSSPTDYEYPLLSQFAPGIYWTGYKRIYAGDPPEYESEAFKKPILPEVKNFKSFFSIGDSYISAHKLNDATFTLYTVKVTIPSELLEETDYENSAPSLKVTQDLAVTHGEKSFLFIQNPQTKRVFFCRLNRFQENSNSSFPENIPAGKTFEYKISDNTKKGFYTLISGPESLKVSSSGVITWTPTQDDIGTHKIKVKLKYGGKISFSRYTVTVSSGNRTSPSDSYSSKGYIRIVNKEYDLHSYPNLQIVTLLADKSIRIMNSSGTRILQKIELKKSYIKLRTRPNYFVALAEHSIDILNRKNGQIIKSISFSGEGKDMALHPAMEKSYITIKTDETKDSVTPSIIAVFNEKNGKLKFLKQAYADKIKIDPTGKYIIGHISFTYRQGLKINWDLGLIMPAFGYVDILVCYRLFSDGIAMLSHNSNPGRNGLNFDISKEGTMIAYAAGGGAPGKGYAISVFDIKNPAKLLCICDIPAYPYGVAFHPQLNLMAGCNEISIHFYNPKTGEELKRYCSFPKTLMEISQMIFSPDGKNMIIVGKDHLHRLKLISTPLDFSQKVKERLNRGISPPVAGRLTSIKDRRTDVQVTVRESRILLDGLKEAHKNNMTTQQIASKYMKSVVVISHAKEFGSGSFISSTGHILTCAHVVPANAKVNILYQTQGGNWKKIPGKVLSIDRERDLCLLKCDLESTPHVNLPTEVEISTGETVAVIGNPGIQGNKMLEHTMTKGIISNNKIVLGGLPYIQTSAAVSPGMSGGPMFDDKGNVIGVIVLKAIAKKSIAMAIPLQQIIEFINKSTK